MKLFGLLLCCGLALAIDVTSYSSSIAQSSTSPSPIVQSPIGSFRGSMTKSLLGRDVYSFRGIRYAEAPIGQNRFRQAKPVQPQQEIFDATEEGPICPQPVFGNHYISEDCLRLNVYTPVLPKHPFTSNANRPVFVFIHGGKMAYGSANEYQPGALLDKDAVLVTINYREGALGFLSTGDERAPGNAGLKDQVQALRWVQQNIAAFGGDPNLVVLLGDYSGSSSTSLHMLSPMSKGLFSRAIMMNKAQPLHEPLQNNETEVARKQAQVLDCPIDTLDNMFECFYAKSAEDFANSLPKMESMYIYTSQTFRAVVEQPGICSDEPFLTMEPLDAFRAGGHNFVPVLLGTNIYNFVDNDTVKAFNQTAMDLMTKNFDKWAPILLDYQRNPRACNITKEFKKFYFNNQPISTKNYNDLFNLYDDALTNFPLHRWDRMMTIYSTVPVRFYWDYYLWCHPRQKWTNGAFFTYAYNDALSEFFAVEGTPPLCPRDVESAEYATNIYVSFAKTGEIAGWDPSLRDQEKYLLYNSTQSRMVVGRFHAARMQKWDELFPMELDQVNASVESSVTSIDAPAHW